MFWLIYVYNVRAFTGISIGCPTCKARESALTRSASAVTERKERYRAIAVVGDVIWGWGVKTDGSEKEPETLKSKFPPIPPGRIIFIVIRDVVSTPDHTDTSSIDATHIQTVYSASNLLPNSRSQLWLKIRCHLHSISNLIFNTFQIP